MSIHIFLEVENMPVEIFKIYAMNLGMLNEAWALGRGPAGHRAPPRTPGVRSKRSERVAFLRNA
jgi:hypothetical protein